MSNARETNEPSSIELFKAHFKYNPEEALKRIHLVAFDLGPEECREKLIPLLYEYQTSGDDLTKYLIAKTWKTLSKFVGGGSHFRSLLVCLEPILAYDEPFVRDQAIETFLKIIKDDKKFSSPSIQISLVNDTVCPMLKRLANDDWFSAPISACYLIPKIYPLASPQNQADLIQCYHNMCDTQFVLVKLAASRNLKPLFDYVDIEEARSLFWLALKNIANDTQERVRIEALEPCLSFAKRCTSEHNESLNVPIIRAAMEDSSWRVRGEVATLIKDLYAIMGSKIIDSHLSNNICQLMSDRVDIVKSNAIEAFVKCIPLLEPKSIELYKNQIIKLPSDDNPDNRRHVVSIIANMDQEVESNRALIKSILPILLKDAHHLVRLAVLRHVDMFKGDLAIDCDTIYTILNELKTNLIWRVRVSLVEEVERLVKRKVLFNIADIFLELLLDHVYKVRSTAIEALERLMEYEQWDSSQLFNEICYCISTKTLPGRNNEEAQEEHMLSYKLRITLIKALLIMHVMDKEASINTLKLAVDDDVPNVKTVALDILNQLIRRGNYFPHPAIGGGSAFTEERSDEGESRDAIPRSIASVFKTEVYPTPESGILPEPCHDSFEDASTKDRGVYPEERGSTPKSEPLENDEGAEEQEEERRGLGRIPGDESGRNVVIEADAILLGASSSPSSLRSSG